MAVQQEDGGPLMQEVTVEGNSTDKNGQFCMAQVTKTDRLITHNTRHIHKAMFMAEQYLRQQNSKGTGWLEDICADTNAIEHSRVSNPYAAGTLGNAYHSSNHENKISGQQVEGSVLGQIGGIVNRTITTDMKPL